jgi:hypothetical protein
MARSLGNAMAFGLALGLVAASGCSSSTSVSGEVTLDGVPLKEGVIRFVPVDGKSQTVSGPIEGGRFNVQVPPGEMRVEISAPKVTGSVKMYNATDSKAVDQVEELLLPRYNVRSDLKMTVQAGSQTKRFELSSK